MSVRLAGHGSIDLVLDDSGPGSGSPPVVLLHGGAQTRFSWGTVGDDLLAAGCRVLALDLRGHGESDWSPDGDYSPAVLLQDLDRVIDYVGERVVLVGASLGGLVSLLYAGRHPGRVVALVLVDVVPENNPDGVERIREFLSADPDGFETFDDAVQAVAAYQTHRDRPANPVGLHRNLRASETGRLMWHWDPQFLLRDDKPWTHGRVELLVDAARQLTVPTGLLVGGDSDVVDRSAVRLFEELVPHAEVRVVEGARHMIAGDRNDVFGAELMTVLRQLTGQLI